MLRQPLARRSLFANLLAGASCACFMPVSAQAASRTERRVALVRAMLAATIPYARAGADDVIRFARGYVDRWEWKFAEIEAAVPLLGLYGSLLHRPLLSSEMARLLEQLERDVATRFLLATRFFDPDRDAQAPLRFDGEQVSGCGNPFARFD